MSSGAGTPAESVAIYATIQTASSAPAAAWAVLEPGAALAMAADTVCALARFCPNGFRRRMVARGPYSLVSLLAFEPGQREHVHQHHDSGEYFHGVVGSGQVLVEDTWLPIGPGLTHFRPAGAWHGVAAATRLLLVSIQAPIPSRAHTVWREPPDEVALRPEDREALARHRCCRCPCCGGHMRRLRLFAACTNCHGLRTTARCENCGWCARSLCLPAGYSWAS